MENIKHILLYKKINTITFDLFEIFFISMYKVIFHSINNTHRINNTNKEIENCFNFQHILSNHDIIERRNKLDEHSSFGYCFYCYFVFNNEYKCLNANEDNLEYYRFFSF